VDKRDPSQRLARHLRALREESRPGRRTTQTQLAQRRRVSFRLISSWKSRTSLRIPTLGRLDACATTRSFDDDPFTPNGATLTPDWTFGYYMLLERQA
jgi:hypothetical protein